MTETKTLNHDKVHFWLDTQTAKEIDPIQSVPAHLRAEFLTIIEKRVDYTYNGLKVLKTARKTNIEIIEDFFSNFDFPEIHDSSLGYFTNYRLKEFVTNFIKCAKSKNKKIPIATKRNAEKTLMRLKNSLSAKAVI